MYYALLANRYLRTRVIPLIAVVAVALCVALVIIVVSVMSGFLDMVRGAGRILMGDVIIQYPVQGIPHYERLIMRLEAMDEVAAATPVVESWGLLRMPYPEGPHKDTKTVQIWGIEAESFARVTGYAETLYWRQIDQRQWEHLFADLLERQWQPLKQAMSEEQRLTFLREVLYIDMPEPREVPDDEALLISVRQMDEQRWEEVFRFARFHPEALRKALGAAPGGAPGGAQWREFIARDPRLTDPDAIRQEAMTLRVDRGRANRDVTDGIVLGMHISDGNRRQRDGSYEAAGGGRWWMPRHEVFLTTVPLVEGGMLDPETIALPVLNEFVSGVYLIDSTRVMIPLQRAQRMLHLDEAERIDEADPFTVTGIDPARATSVLVRGAEGVRPAVLRDLVAAEYDRLAWESVEDGTFHVPLPPLGMGLSVKTWEQQQAQFIGPVEKERELMRILFSIVYVVAAGLVLAIFWAIVHEKTRDIGILRSVGASRIGISAIFLRYGAIIGVIGSVIGLGLAWLVVSNINEIHNAVGEDAPRWSWMLMFTLAAAALAMTIYQATARDLMLPVVLWALATIGLAALGVGLYVHRGTLLWDPTVYYFAEIPDRVDMPTAITTMIAAVVFSILGAFIPAAKAADTDPVHALRYE